MKSLIAAAAVIVAAGPAFAQSGEASRGQRVFNTQCRTCHSVEKGVVPPVGPNLNGLFGRRAGTLPGFEFSDAMKASGIVWDEATLAEYARDPKAKVPGGKMVFAGVKNPTQLADLIAYLKEATK
jgi:cytochrome c